MKTIYILFYEDFGEIDIAFDKDGAPLHWWSCNDATWRQEYFGPLMKTLGVEVKTSADPDTRKKFLKNAIKTFGLSDY